MVCYRVSEQRVCNWRRSAKVARTVALVGASTQQWVENHVVAVFPLVLNGDFNQIKLWKLVLSCLTQFSPILSTLVQIRIETHCSMAIVSLVYSYIIWLSWISWLEYLQIVILFLVIYRLCVTPPRVNKIVAENSLQGLKIKDLWDRRGEWVFWKHDEGSKNWGGP